MSQVIYIQNDEYDHAGLLGTVLREQGVGLDVVHAWKGEPVPTVPNGWSGIVLGGGGMSAYEADKYPFLESEIRLIHAAQEKGTPVLGICLGAQLMAAALGGRVFPNSKKEVGFYDVRFTPEATNDRLWSGDTATFQPVHWHGDAFSLPPGAVLLGSSELTPHQIFRVEENLYGIQFHLEIDEPVLTEMIETDSDWLRQHGIDPDQFLQEGRVALPKVEPIGRRVFTRWIELL